MAVPFPAWLTSTTGALRRLADQPATLFALLLALNALGRPCSITAHDARLYSLQALNQAEQGAYAGDVFLSYGSQDQFSLFSRLVGPLVAVCGLRLTFLLLYLVFNTLLIYALFRLVRALIDDPIIATLALVFLVTAPLTYGGGGIFTVHEQFFTPRTVGTAFTLFALERLLKQRFGAALGFLVAGLLVHPLMAFGGVMIWLGTFAASKFSVRTCLALLTACVLAGVALLALPTVATRLFGTMDDDWHHLIRLAVGYNYPDTWAYIDWLNVAVSFALPIIAGCTLFRGDPVRQRFFAVVTLAGAIGLLTTIVASFAPYALLFQGQPYRVLWILKVFQVPLGFLLIARWLPSPVVYQRITAAALVGFFCLLHYSSQEAWIFVVMLAFSLCYEWAKTVTSWSYAVARGCVLGALGWTTFRVGFFLKQHEILTQHFDVNEWALFDLISPIVWLVALCLAAAYLPQAFARFSIVRWTAVAVALLMPLLLFAAESSPTQGRLGNDMAFVREFIHQRRPASTKVPAIYASLGRPDLLWIDVRATSYFDILQTAGVMFQRPTALEIERRVQLVNKFEMARQRQEEIFLNDDLKLGMENLFGIPFHSPNPTPTDLARLCQEPNLDFVVLPYEFPGLVSAGNGRVYVYECRQVRTALRLPEPATTTAVAARSLTENSPTAR